MRTSIAVVVFTLMSGLPVQTAPIPWGKRPAEVSTPIRILYVEFTVRTPRRADARYRKPSFDIVAVPLHELADRSLKKFDVIFLPTSWAFEADRYKKIEACRQKIQNFVRRGGGLFVCQPNPSGTCTPTLLPYPITFRNGYDDKKPARVKLEAEHFITIDLPDNAMPFPADPMLDVDRHYRLLVKQKSTGWPSLAVCTFGKGRIVIQTANENAGATIPLSDKILHRMVVWAARREANR